ncbi:MAG: Na+/H+ antiporter subunit E [Bacteroidales bacterium]|nr:Na+/H+ antiporter subunit E [Bacteroidales bacterium]
MKNLFVSFVVLMIAWLLLNWTLDPINLLIGSGLSIALSFIFCSKCELFTSINLTPKAFLYTFLYLGVFLIELIKANIDVTKRVLSPSLPINPGIVKVKTRLKSKMARLILADSITLTPGTFTLQVEGDTFYIHWINVEHTDVETATKELVSKFEKYLEVLYD